jgi:hypothetical protein
MARRDALRSNRQTRSYKLRAASAQQISGNRELLSTMKGLLGKKPLSSVTLPLIIGIVSIAPVQGNAQSIARQQVTDYRVSEEELWFDLGELAVKDKVPIGLESPLDHRLGYEGNGAPIEVKSGTVQDVLDAVISFRPGYKWEEVDGVINLFPRNGRESLLEVKISKFSVKDKSTGEIINTLLASPEVSTKLLELGLEIDHTSPLPSGYDVSSSRPYTFALENVRVRDILNYLIKNTHNKYWCVQRFGPAKRYFSLRVW